MGTGASVEGPVSKEDAEKIAGDKWDEKKFASHANDDNKIPVKEWANLVDISSKFDYYDTDSDGFLTSEELSRLLKESGYVDEEVVAGYIAEMMLSRTDENADGKLDYGEFIRVYRALQKNYQAGLDKIDTSHGKAGQPDNAAATTEATEESAPKQDDAPGDAPAEGEGDKKDEGEKADGDKKDEGEKADGEAKKDETPTEATTAEAPAAEATTEEAAPAAEATTEEAAPAAEEPKTEEQPAEAPATEPAAAE